MTINKLNRETFLPTTALGATPVYAEKHNTVVEKVNDISTEAGVGKFNTISEYSSGSGVTVDGVLLKDGTITTTAPTIISVAPAVTAHAGGGKASATALTEELNVVTTCATALDSVLLPAAVVGQTIVVANLGAATCAVYGAGTNTIDDIITANYAVIQVEDVVTFHCYTTAKWQSDFESDGVYTTLYTNVIAENTSGSGVTIDGVLLKDYSVDAGSSGNAGIVDIFPSTASKGKIAIAAVDNTGDTTLTITNVAQTGAASFTIPDSGAGYFGVSTAALSLAEMDVLDGVSAGTQTAGKAVIANSDVNTGVSKVTELHIGTSGSETQVTATAAELNYCDVTTAGTAEASKALVADASKDITSINDISCAGITSSDLTATTVVLSSGAKALESSGVTPTELSYLDLTTGAGTAEASKAVVLDASSDVTGINDVSLAGLTSSDLAVTTVVLSSAAKKLESSGVTPTELNFLDGATAGTQVASKAVVANADVNTGISKVTELHIGATGSETQVNSTGAELNLLDGSSTANSIASVASVLNASKELVTNANIGTVGAGTVTAAEVGDGKNHVTTLTLTDFIVGPLAGAAAAKILVPPTVVYTFPAGVHVLTTSYTSIGLTAAGTAVSPDVGLGSVVGDGSANNVLSAGAAGNEDTLTGYAIADTVTHAAVVSGPVGVTAGILTGIALNKAADAKTLYLNAGATWNADNTGNLTASGTIVIHWTSLA